MRCRIYTSRYTHPRINRYACADGHASNDRYADARIGRCTRADSHVRADRHAHTCRRARIDNYARAHGHIRANCHTNAVARAYNFNADALPCSRYPSRDASAYHTQSCTSQCLR